MWTGKPKPGGLPSDLFGGANPPDERKEGIVALVGLCYEIFKGKK